MKAMQKSFFGLAVAGVLWWGASGAWAEDPMMLTNHQLDHVTAGGAVVVSSTDAFATGALSLVSTTSNSVISGGTSPKGQPGLTNSTGAADGTATAVGTNVGLPGAPSPTSGTSVVTAGVADGNMVVNSTINRTVQGAGGVNFQVGWTFVYGAWRGL